MFETFIQLKLQEWFHPALDQFFLALTWLGYERGMEIIIVFLIFGIDIRKGFLLTQLFIWNAALVEVLKKIIAYPRPFMVDNRVIPIGIKDAPYSPFTNEGAKSFFGLINSDVVDQVRKLFANFSQSWGMPSGHTSESMEIFGALIYFYRKYWVYFVCGFLIIFIPLSRLYLGMHFLADVVVGYLIGIMLLVLFIKFVVNNSTISSWLFSPDRKAVFSKESLIFMVFIVLPPAGGLLISKVTADQLTAVIGLNLGFFFVWLRGVPFYVPSMKYSLARLAFAAFWMFVLSQSSDIAIQLLGAEGSTLATAVKNIIVYGLLVFVGMELMIKLNFLTREQPPTAQISS